MNIVAGTNGVGKTKLLKFIQENKGNNKVIFNNEHPDLKNIASFSPKRNATKTLINQAQKILRRDPNAKENTLNQFFQQLQDDTFQEIRSISETLVLAFEELRDRQNKKPTDAAIEVGETFTKLLKDILGYKIKFTWNPKIGNYNFLINKDGSSLHPNQLSSGENELMSLIFALYYSKDSTQIYLIDEPEVHLNWQLEEKMFRFLNWFAEEYQKQLIVATHSRACFMDPFLSKTQFLMWKENNIEIENRPTEETKKLLAGDLVKIVGGLTTENKLIYVEDNSHECILKEINRLLELNLEVSKVGNRSDVEKLSKGMKSLNVDNLYFIIDNDNRQIKNPQEHLNLIQLKKYCIENYFLDETILDKIDQRLDKTKPIKTVIVEAIKQVRDSDFAVVRELIKGEGNLTQDVLDRIDASKFISGKGNDLVKFLNFTNKDEFLKSYLNQLHIDGTLADSFDFITYIS